MSHIDPGPLASYGSLSDPNLTAYFSNSRMRKHLIKSGLVTRRGEIVSEKVFRLNNSRKEHQRHVRDLLAQAIVHKALDMERHRQMQIKRQLEEIGKVERVRRVRADRALRGDEDILPLLSPSSQKVGMKKKQRPHTAPAEQSSKQSTSNPPSMSTRQLPQSVGYPAIPGDSPYNTRSTRIKTPYPNVEIDNQYLSQLDQEALRTFTLNLSNYDLGSGVSPYTVPVLDPASRELLPPPKSKKPKSSRRSKRRSASTTGVVSKKEERSSYPRATNKRSLALHRFEPPMIYRTQSRSLCLMTFKYLGQIVNLDCEKEDPRDEISVDQQHCGGGNLCVYRGKLLKGNNFTIISQRHRGFPFSLTFYLNGIMVERLSVCCEYKHKMGSKLGAKTSHFGFVKVEGAHPCFKCLVASGRLRSSADQSAQRPNTFTKQDYQNEEKKSPRTTKVEVNKAKEEDKYDDSFASSDESSDESSVSSLTPTEDEDQGPMSPKSLTNKNLQKSRTPSPKPRVTSPTFSKSSKSSLYDSDNTGKSNHSKASTSDSRKHKKTDSSSDFSSSKVSSESSSSSDEEERVVYESPTALKASIHSLMNKNGTFNASNYRLSDDQVTELCSFLKEDSLSFQSIILYNCGLAEKDLTEILETTATFCTNIKSVKVGRNDAVCVDALLQLVQAEHLEVLVLDDTIINSQEMKQLMSGMKLLQKPSEKTTPKQTPRQFNQLTLLSPTSATSDEGVSPSLQCLSLNRTRIDLQGIKALSDFLSVNPSLTTLQLNSNSLTGDCLEPLWKVLSAGENRHLSTLTLSENKLNDKSMEQFSDLMTKRSVLQKLDFTGNGISDSGAAYLIEFAKKNNSIKKINIAKGNNIKRKTLKKLKEGIAPKKSK